ncbi:MAG: hypothetical protein Sylvanvirus4_25 [Sylvanvirus sp.]|uniref:Uncharacterized protein n=1 Tax=Sylvanvirus sp. TaxID=2487774 RepID=A0A3G5AJI7_9VIRU|nr:MAG: hypothetical protein Sylvanvirus4_25 [Sylvanvirus sp.]
MNHSHLLAVGRHWIWNSNVRSGTWLWNDSQCVSNLLRCSMSFYHEERLQRLRRMQRYIRRFLVWYPWKLLTTKRISRRPPLWFNVSMDNLMMRSISQVSSLPQPQRVKWLIRKPGTYRLDEGVVVNVSNVDIILLLQGSNITLSGGSIRASLNVESTSDLNPFVSSLLHVPLGQHVACMTASFIPHVAFCIIDAWKCHHLILENFSLAVNQYVERGLCMSECEDVYMSNIASYR